MRVSPIFVLASLVLSGSLIAQNGGPPQSMTAGLPNSARGRWFMDVATSPSEYTGPITTAHAPWPTSSFLSSAAAGAGGSGGPSPQDGDPCPRLDSYTAPSDLYNPFDPSAPLAAPAGLPPAGNYSLIGAAPYDLGGMFRGGSMVPAQGLRDGSTLQAMALQGTPLAHPANYGAAFAIGGHGTVSPTTGAFVHPFTLLALPSYVPNMGLGLQLQYLSNARHSSFETMPFGPGFVLSGHDLLVETSGASASAGAQTVVLYRGDGQFTTFQRGNQTTSPWLYTAAGALDKLRAELVNGEITYILALRDGRSFTYERINPGIPRFVRSKVADGYGNAIVYTWTKSNGNAYLDTITDTRNVHVRFVWDQVLPQRITSIFVDTLGAQFDPATRNGPAITATDLKIDFDYDGSRRLQRIRWFPTSITYDANSDWRVDLASETSSVRPTLEFEYEGNNRLAKIWDKTVAATPILQLHMEYELTTQHGVRVIKQAEGGVIGPTGVQHLYAYPSDLSRTYTDPRGRTAALTLQPTSFLVTQVTMAHGPLTPRSDDTFTLAGEADHATLTWTLGYDSCCSIPTSVVEPTSRPFTFEWNGNSLARVRVGGLTTHAFDLDAAGRVLAWRVGDATLPAQPPVRAEFIYTDLVQGQAAPTTLVVQSVDYFEPRSNTNRGKSIVTLTFDAKGRLATAAHSNGGSTTFAYHSGVVKGRDLLSSITGAGAGAALRVAFVCDDLGRISAMKRGLDVGERTVELFTDPLHRVNWTSAIAATGLPMQSEVYFDRFSGVSLSRRENRKPDGAARARLWLQSETIRDSFGRTTRTVVDGAPVDAVAEDAIITQSTWHADHRVHTVTAHDGGITTYVWDGYGLLYKMQQQADSTTTLTPTRLFYDKDGQLLLQKDGLGNNLTIERMGGTGLVQYVNDPANRYRIRLGYQAANPFRIATIEVQDPATSYSVARVTNLDYDELGRVKRVWRGNGTLMSSSIYIYDNAGHLEEVGMQKHSTDMQYLRGFKRQFDSYGRLVSERDRLSDLVVNSNELWNQRRYEYHAKTGLPTKLIEREIEQVGEFGVLTGAQNHVTRLYETLFEHDLLDRVTRMEQLPETGQLGTSVVHTYHYDSLGALVRFEDTMGAELEWLYDGLGGERKRTERGVNNGEITTLRDVNFTTNVVTRTDAEGRVSRFEFDLAGRLKKQVFPGGSSGPMFVQSFEYDAASQLIWMLNGNAREIVREYDDSGRLKVHRVVAPAGPAHSVAATREEFTYNVFGNVETLTTKGGVDDSLPVVTVTQAEDAVGRLQWERYEFNGLSPLDVISNYQQGTEEDLLVRRGLNVQGTPAVSFHLDALGRTWGYGDANTPGASSVNVSDFIARYRFVGGRVRERQQGGYGTNPNNWLLKADAGWDPLRRLTSIGVSPLVGPAVPLSTFDYTYDAQGHVTKRKRDRVGVTPGGGDMFQLDEYYRLDEAKLGVPSSQFGGTFANATSFQRHVDYSPASAPLDKAQSRHMVRETTSSGTTDTAYAVNATSHRYDSVGGVPLIHDGEGNLLFDGRSYFLYDFKNRLSEVWQYVPADGEEALQTSGSMARSSSGSREARYLVPRERLERIRNRARNTLLSAERMRRGYADVTGRMALANQDSSTAAVEGNLALVAVYGYDPYNRRVARFLLNQAPLFSTWDGWREVAEYQPGSTWQAVRAYVWGGRIDELIRYSRNDAGTWVHYHPQQDHQDSVDLLVDANGVPREKYEYDPFGAVKVFQWDSTANNWGNVSVPYSAAGNPYTFTGRRLDLETGLMYYRNRYYSPPLGRFVTGDPIGLWGDVHSVGNPYAYGGNSPAFLGDPMGLQVTAKIMGKIFRFHSPDGFKPGKYPAVSLKYDGIDYGTVDLTVEAVDEAGRVTKLSLSGYKASTKALDDLQSVLDIAGAANPLADVANAAISIARGDIRGAAFNLIGAFLPYPVSVLRRGGTLKVCTAAGSQLTGQLHHGISKVVHDALENHQNLRGVYRHRDTRFVAQAKDLASHNGYDTFHRNLDAEVARWVRRNPEATQAEFEAYLRGVYQRPDVAARFPNGL